MMQVALWFHVHWTLPKGVKDGKIFARGSEDNGQAAASILFTFEALRKLG